MQQRLDRVPHFGLADDAAFWGALRDARQTVVLWRGVPCGWSDLFLDRFLRTEAPPGWRLVVRDVEAGGEGPVGSANGIDVTPTLVAYLGERETARLEAVEGRGLALPRFAAWLAAIA
jgi:hypothetical protein